jgi:hypothetical protein
MAASQRIPSLKTAVLNATLGKKTIAEKSSKMAWKAAGQCGQDPGNCRIVSAPDK